MGASLATVAVLWVVGKIGQLPTVISIPSDAVVAFNANECPNRWREYTPAYGRFIRGVDKSERPVDPDGRRVVGHYQEDAIQKHHHSRRYHQANTTGSRPHPNFEYQDDNGNATLTTTDIVDARVGEETRPKNVALLYCEKT